MNGPVCLVTGGAGLLGSEVARLMSRRGWRIRVIDLLLPGGGGHERNLRDIANLESVTFADIRDEATLREALTGCEAVVHAAAHTSHAGSMGDPRMDLSINVEGTAAVLESVCRVAPQATFILASTRQIYGKPISLPVTEDHPLDPPDVNGIGKRATEDLTRLYGKVHGLKHVILRFTNIYGPGLRIKDAQQMFLGIWIRRALENGEITVFGDGEQRRDLLYVQDAAEAVCAALHPEAAGLTFNVGSEETVSLGDLAAELIAKAGGGTLVFRPFPEERKLIDIGNFASDSTRIWKALGWRPLIQRAQGLEETLAYYRAHLREYVERAS